MGARKDRYKKPAPLELPALRQKNSQRWRGRLDCRWPWMCYPKDEKY